MLRIPLRNLPLAVMALTLLLCACKGAGGFGASPGIPVAGAQSSGKIQHVVIIVQENRSFNNLFYGYPGAKTATFGYNSKGQKIMLKPVSLATNWDPQHDARGFLTSCNGTGSIPGTHCRMNGFDNESENGCGGSGEPKCPPNPPYSYVPRGEVQPYLSMAHQYVLADEMFASDFDTSSFISHQYIIAGVNPDSTLDYPDQQWGCPGKAGTDGIKVLHANRVFNNQYPTVYPCWNPTTLGDELDKAGLTWAYYAVNVTASRGANPAGKSSRGSGIWSAYQAIKHIYYGKDWANDVISPPQQFLRDVSSGLRTVTWITPTDANSDHGGSDSKTGPSWVASLVNAIGESKDWDSTAIFIFWDDSGGWFDPAKPPYVDNDGFGMRLPLLIISPYAKKGVVSHVHYEHGSILQFVEDQFSLPRLAQSDTRANSVVPDCFDFSQSPRKFVRIGSPYDENYFKVQPLDRRPPDSE